MTINNKIEKIIISPKYIGYRFDFALAKLLPSYSRAKISTWIKQGKATIEGRTINGKDRVKQAIALDIITELEPAYKWQAQDIALNIVYQDKDIIIINKPAGMVTHPGAGNSDNTLANALLFFDDNLEKLDRAGIVHRLDKDTSGLLVVARSPIAQKSLIKQLEQHQVTREYIAVVYGNMIAGGTIAQPIGRHARERIKQAVHPLGKRAITHYRVLERFKNHSVVKLALETGRTHQIRVHMAHIGYSLVSDKIYAKYGGTCRFPKAASKELKQVLKRMTRQALHSKKISLTHPTSGKIMSWESNLANDMQVLIDNLRIYDKHN